MKKLDGGWLGCKKVMFRIQLRSLEKFSCSKAGVTSLDSSFSNLSTLQGKRAINFGCPKNFHVDSVVAIHFFPCPTDWFGCQLSNPSSFTPDLEDSCRCRCCATHSCSFQKKTWIPLFAVPTTGRFLHFWQNTYPLSTIACLEHQTFRILIKTIIFLVNFDMASIFVGSFRVWYHIHHFCWNLGMIHDLCLYL